ncbi:beta-propeller domain-containing protein, partial [Candidatus Micrarchaeota archaeon]|nr:beta-propeller domain-containing protein [Candidatus Micrarchaeota archaeon]MBU1929944.1 beta-propeller domain-containing protein [Candidatus Micrarchaeota archaeon]
ERTGSLEDLAPGEQIYSARFMGKKGYLVTFKKIDPLFVIDLSDHSNPRVLGKLKIPGYSDYLHPFDETHIIGVGKHTIEAAEGDFAWYQGVKLAVFDVSDVENPKEMHQIIIGDRGTDSIALQDHKAFLFDREKELLILPITLAEIPEEIKESDVEQGNWPQYGEFTFQGAYVYNLSLANGFELKGRITHDETGEDILKSGYYYQSDNQVKRSLYIGNVLYTISNTKILLNDLFDLSELNQIELVPETA